MDQKMLDATLCKSEIKKEINSTNYNHLSSIDWTFEKAKTRSETHGLHPYPAKFIPQIPRELISNLYPNDGSAILDPFCGSGTTLVEASLNGIPSIGIDLHPLACLISKVKTTPISTDLINASQRVLNNVATEKVKIPLIPALDHWFMPNVQEELTRITCNIEREEDPDIKDALKVALSSIIVRISNQDSDTRYAAIEKDVSQKQIHQYFTNASKSLQQSLRNTWAPLPTKPDVQIIHKNILKVDPDEIGKQVSLVITSPPYPNAYEYWLYHKYRMYWLGMDPIQVRKEEIGARPHYFKKNPQTAADFEEQMSTVFALLATVVKKSGHVCFQVGRSIIRGETIDNCALIQRAAAPYGFKFIQFMERTIPSKRKAFNPSHAGIKKEQIVIFRQEN